MYKNVENLTELVMGQRVRIIMTPDSEGVQETREGLLVNFVGESRELVVQLSEDPADVVRRRVVDIEVIEVWEDGGEVPPPEPPTPPAPPTPPVTPPTRPEPPAEVIEADDLGPLSRRERLREWNEAMRHRMAERWDRFRNSRFVGWLRENRMRTLVLILLAILFLLGLFLLWKEYARDAGLIPEPTPEPAPTRVVAVEDQAARGVIEGHEVRIAEVEGKVDDLKKAVPPAPTLSTTVPSPVPSGICETNVSRAWTRSGRAFTTEEVRAKCQDARGNLGF